ncbi:MAG TPA: copper resistance protein CopC [Actinomycetes bacterium]|nr:copper resistance protein CopC [Actinomycetes bacterium]
MAGAPAASAHAAVVGSEPEAGASMPHAPRAVVLHLTEAPERGLSTIEVLDTRGRRVDRGMAEAVPGRSLQLQVPLTPLAAGTYTVSWRVVSRVDGHPTSGVFSFGVGTPAPDQPAVARETVGRPDPSSTGVLGRWALYWGLALLLGAAATGLVVFDRRLPRRPGSLLGLAVLLLAGGLVGMVAGALTDAGTDAGGLLASTTGHWLLARAALVVLTALLAAAVTVRPGARWLLGLLGIAASGGMLVHALAGHAAAPSGLRGLHLLAQWAHLLAVGIWIGGLAWLLQGLRGQERDAQVRASLRFSRLATLGLVTVVATGLARAVPELGSWRHLLDTGFGRALLVKLGLFAGLALLGATNRFVVIPRLRAGRGRLTRLRGTVVGELGLAAGILLAAALLSVLPPSATAERSAARTVAPVAARATGSDFTTSVRVTLGVSPGIAGPNRFEALVADYDTGQPAASVEHVRLVCALPARPQLAPLDLELRRAADGRWHARGDALALAGAWSVTAVVEQDAQSLSVPLTLRIGAPVGAPPPGLAHAQSRTPSG